MNNGDLPASPIDSVDYMHVKERPYCNGLTKREAFAMAAMQGILSNSNRWHQPDDLASMALGRADALLKELDK